VAAMTADLRLIERSGELKQQLVQYAQRRRFDRARNQLLDEQFDRQPRIDEAALINALDQFALQEKLHDGRTVVEHFVAAHPELTEEERDLLLGWRDVVQGIFEVTRRDGDALILLNLLDDLTYRVYSNHGPEALAPIRPRSFLMTRLVPIGDAWLISGAATILPAASRDDVYRVALDTALRFPALVFRNPDKLAEGWELQREDRAHFIALFGTDSFVLPGHELTARMDALMHYRMFDVRDAGGRTAAERQRDKYGGELPKLDHDFPPELLAAASVGVFYDEIEGLCYYINYAAVAEIFADPSLAADPRRRELVLEYLEDDTIAPFVFRRLAEPDPTRASQVFARILEQPEFSWERDGEALLRQYKAEFFAKPPLPTFATVSDVLAKAHVGRQRTRPQKQRKKRSRPAGGGGSSA
jgi:hypothetical protein